MGTDQKRLHALTDARVEVRRLERELAQPHALPNEVRQYVLKRLELARKRVAALEAARSPGVAGSG